MVSLNNVFEMKECYSETESTVYKVYNEATVISYEKKKKKNLPKL
jgi:hypothetical protein